MAAYLASLGNQLEPGQLFDQLPVEVRAFTDQHDDVSVLEAHRQLPQTLDGIGVNLGGVGVQLGCALQLSNRILIVIEDHNIHAPDCACTLSPHWRRLHTNPLVSAGYVCVFKSRLTQNVLKQSDCKQQAVFVHSCLRKSYKVYRGST